MVKKIALLLQIALQLSASCHSQMEKLAKGTTVPDVKLNIQVGDSTYSTTLCGFKGKLLLLDFWGTHCGTCIASFPEILDLQRRFRDSLQILMVTEEPKSEVARLFKKLSENASSSHLAKAGKQLALITEDSVLNALFPHKVQPTHVWIDDRQVFRYMSYSNTTTQQTIEAMVRDEEVKLNEMEFKALDMDNPLSWFINDRQSYSGYFSFITPYIENGGDARVTRIVKDSTGRHIIGLNCLNRSIVELYNEAYLKDWKENTDAIPENRVLIESKNPDRFLPPKNTDVQAWWKKNGYSYSLRIPSSLYNKIYSFMRQDLDRFFSLTSKIERRKVRCFVLKVVQGKRIFAVDARQEQAPYGDYGFNEEKGKLILKNVRMDMLVNYYLKNLLSDQGLRLPLINDTKYAGNIDIELFWDKNPAEISIPRLQASLRKYGLDLVKEERFLNMLVIKDK